MTKSNNHEMIEKLRHILGGKEVNYQPDGDPGCFRLRIDEYFNDNLYIDLFVDDTPYSNITVNLDWRLPWYEFYVDANNFPDAIDLLFDNNIARWSGVITKSGFCHYPLFKLEEDIIKEVERLKEEEK